MQLVIRATCSRLLFLVGWNIWIIEICYAQLIPEVPSECTHDVPASLALSTLSMLNETLGESDKEFQTCFEQVLQSRSLLHPDQELRTDGIIKKYGYNLVTYANVTTEDGYILMIFRISGSPSSPPEKAKPVVLLYHGLSVASDSWLLQYGNKNLAFKLVNAGYDVWLANLRGTDFSQGHVNLNMGRDMKYWDFSFHEMAIYDFPATLDVIFKETGNYKILFVCHSMGCAVYAAALAEKPELNDRIYASVFLAPGIFTGHAYNFNTFLTPLLKLNPVGLSLLNFVLRGRIDTGSLANILQSRACTPTAIRCGICGSVLFFLYGYDAPQINFTDLPNIVSKNGNTISLKTLVHLGQNYKSCQFRKYDMGSPIRNMRTYGQSEPPTYNLGTLTAPIYIFYGDADNYTPPVDAIITRDKLPSGVVRGLYRVDWHLFNHIDFLIAKDADVLVYDQILDILKKHVDQH